MRRRRLIRVHGNLHAGNVRWHDRGCTLVGFEESCMGPAVQDLWLLLTGARAERARQLADLLAGYESHAEFDRRELALIEALRTLRLLHHTAWIARRGDDPALPAASAWSSTPHSWEGADP